MGSEVNGVAPSGSSQHVSAHGLGSAAIRSEYNERLHVLSSRLQLEERKLGNGTEEPCRLAENAVTARDIIRIESRLQGSAFAHLILIIRDVWKYGTSVMS